MDHERELQMVSTEMTQFVAWLDIVFQDCAIAIAVVDPTDVQKSLIAANTKDRKIFERLFNESTKLDSESLVAVIARTRGESVQ